MSSTMSQVLLAVSVATAGGLNFSCSSDTAPKAGTPAYFWAAAKETFAAGDYGKTSEHLDKVLATDNEYTARARPWRLILTSGMARGYMDLADNLEYGVKAKKADPGGFRKYISNSRSTAGRLGLQFAEAFMLFQKGKDDPIVLGFNFPSGSAAAVPEFARASVGTPLLPTELESAQKHAIERAILLQTCEAAGAADDTAKALELFKNGNATFSTQLLSLPMSCPNRPRRYCSAQGSPRTLTRFRPIRSRSRQWASRPAFTSYVCEWMASIASSSTAL